MSLAIDRFGAPRDGRPPPADLDAIDRCILEVLGDDGRISMRALALEVGVSRTSAYARVERLRELGVITGFTVRLDPWRLGLGVTAHVVVTLEQHGWQHALEAFRAIPEVAYCALMAADVDVLLVVRSTDVATLRDVVLEQLNQIPGVRRTRTLLVLEDFTTADTHMLESLPTGP